MLRPSRIGIRHSWRCCTCLSRGRPWMRHRWYWRIAIGSGWTSRYTKWQCGCPPMCVWTSALSKPSTSTTRFSGSSRPRVLTCWCSARMAARDFSGGSSARSPKRSFGRRRAQRWWCHRAPWMFLRTRRSSSSGFCAPSISQRARSPRSRTHCTSPRKLTRTWPCCTSLKCHRNSVRTRWRRTSISTGSTPRRRRRRCGGSEIWFPIKLALTPP